MAMLLPLLGQLSLSSQILSFRSSPPTPLLTCSSFQLLLRHSKPYPLPSSFPLKPPFSFHRIQSSFVIGNSSRKIKEKINKEDLDPIHSFFKSREPVPDPKHGEGFDQEGFWAETGGRGSGRGFLSEVGRKADVNRGQQRQMLKKTPDRGALPAIRV